MKSLAHDDFQFLARLLRRRSGLWLTPEKLPLVERRLIPVMRRFGFRSVTGLVAELRHGRDTLAAAVTEAVTVNETSFFRNAKLFGHFAKVLLPEMLAKRGTNRRLRIWCAASSTGQEAYSIAMVLDELGLAAAGWSVDLIATDISREVVARAGEGRYDALEMARGLDEDQRTRWFRHEGEHWCVAPHLRRMVDFRVFNLLDSLGWLDDLDFVFCRNVLFYFDRAARASVLERIGETMAEDGILILGDAESCDSGVFVEAPYREGVYLKNRAPVTRLVAL
ncbi:MAG TPA: protein-glutamate O-methyltransferase CheR [Rhizomicrobium sp.]|nr:protein-glutamate O-methyltransferase CheR [Rhizomicrobium sp.]